MTTQEITLNQSSDGGFYTKLLRGRYVTSIDNDVITLDNGTELRIWGNDGCMSCSNGSYWLEQVFKRGNSKARIMSAYVDCDEDDGNPSTVYTIFGMVDGNPPHLPLATVRGDDGNGYYGTGFTLTATIETPPAPPTTSSRPSRVRKHPRLSPVFLAAKASSMLSLTLSSEREALIRLCVLPAPRLGFFIS